MKFDPNAGIPMENPRRTSAVEARSERSRNVVEVASVQEDVGASVPLLLPGDRPGRFIPRNLAAPAHERDARAHIERWAAALAEQVHQLPEILQERITAIANAVRQGTYHISPEQTAEAVLSDLHTHEGTAA